MKQSVDQIGISNEINGLQFVLAERASVSVELQAISCRINRNTKSPTSRTKHRK